MKACMLTIFAPPALEETLVDWLLEHEKVAGFSTAEIHGHGARPTGMTLLEQVTGRQRRVQFLIQTDIATTEEMLQQMREQYAGVGLHYIVTPVLDAGRI